MLRRSIFAAALVGSAALCAPGGAARAEGVRLCTGKEGGNYHEAGAAIRAQAKGRLDVQLVPSAGSLDNLDALARGACEAAIVQSDALFVYGRRRPGARLSVEVAADLYTEYLHFVCNPDAGLSKVTKLSAAQRVEVGANGGGTGITWEAFRIADPKRYKDVPTDPLDGPRALARVGAMTEQDRSRVACLAYVTGLRAPVMQQVDEWAKANPGKASMVAADDSDLPGVRDDFGKPLYARVSVPGGTYPNLQPKGMFGSSQDVPTLGVRAVAVVASTYIEADPSGYDEFLRAVGKAAPSIRGRVGQ